VTRYFGGTKLGRGGLVRAYSEVAGLALEEAGVREHIITRRFRIEFPYDYTARALRTVEVVGGAIVSPEYSDVAAYLVDIRLSECDSFRDGFAEQLAGRGTIRVVTEEVSD
jgi:putative IMPACT (imprinted ancient) family translation regulator